MDKQSDKEIAGKKQRDQMLKLVAKSFYNELTKYGVSEQEIIHMASHLLDNLLAKERKPAEGVEYYNGVFTLASVRDEWTDCKQLAVQHVTLRPLQLADVSRVSTWLKVAGCPRKLRPTVSGKAKRAAKLFCRSDTGIFRHLLRWSAGRNCRR